jgi:hypothetical protein
MIDLETYLDRLLVGRQWLLGVRSRLHIGAGSRVLAQVSGEHLHNRPVQLGRVPGHLL